MWSASTAEGIGKAERQLAIGAFKWDYDPDHNGAICDTNAAGAVLPGTKKLVGLWRHCEGAHLHTVPHTFVAANAADAASYAPNISINVPYVRYAHRSTCTFV